jgi:hypothetical protein
VALIDLRAVVRVLTVARAGFVRPVRARLVLYQVDRRRSPEHFSLLVAVDLHLDPAGARVSDLGARGEAGRARLAA